MSKRITITNDISFEELDIRSKSIPVELTWEEIVWLYKSLKKMRRKWEVELEHPLVKKNIPALENNLAMSKSIMEKL